MMPRTDLEGHLKTISHVFYLQSNKCCFLQIQDSHNVEHLVMVPLEIKPLLLHLQNGLDLTGSGLKLSCLSRISSRNVLKVTKSSAWHFTSDFRSGMGVVNEGIVTDDTHAVSGVYRLNKGVTLITTWLCYITNIGRFARGQTVLVCNAHLIRDPDFGLILIACARSMVILKDRRQSSVHDKEVTDRFVHDSIVQLTLKLDLKYSNILQLLLWRDFLSKHFPNSNFSVISPDDHNPLESIADLFCRPKSTRLLIHEYLDHENQCFMKTKSWPSPGLYSVHSIQESEQKFRNELNEEQMIRKSCYLNASNLSLDYCSRSYKSTRVLIGSLRFHSGLARVVLEDDTGFLPICVKGGINTLIDQLVMITKYVVMLEWFCLPLPNEREYQLMYVMCESQDVTILAEQSGPKFKNDSIACSSCPIRNLSDPIFVDGEFHLFVQTAKEYLKIPVKVLPHIDISPGSVLQIPNAYHSKTESSAVIFSSSGYFGYNSLPISNARTILPQGDHPIIVESKHRDLNDSYDIADIGAIPCKELVSISGIVYERWLENTLYPKDNKTSHMYPKLEPSVPNLYNLQLKLSPPISDASVSSISLYVMNWSAHVYPIGALPKRLIRVDNVVKINSQKGNPYFVTTSFSRFRILQKEDSQTGGLGVVSLFDGLESKLAFRCVLNLISILKLSITAKCDACGNTTQNGVCSFVGCHNVNGKPILAIKGRFNVEDGSGKANLFFNDLKENVLKRVLHLNSELWHELERQVHANGELVHFQGGKNLDRDANVLHLLCSLITYTHFIQLECHCRPFPRNDPDEEFVSLFCTEMSIK
ncbi:hypothetical protein TCAL_14587 [Tigriopus californicus]|uniref:CST complex subunit CTC1 n=1 Tax=Tigriopus californicus TaxID=6832 RepID=A0A553PBZ0_TIGCA|nr:hypothetical protein TCAL_14587 [Tigriopus californicus]